VGQHPSASASGLLGLDGFEVTAAEVTDDEWRLALQTIAATVGCAACGTQARLHARRTVQVRDLPVGGAGLAQADLALCGAGLCGPDLERAANRDPASGGADRAGPGRGLPTGRQGCPRGRRRRPGPGGAVPRPAAGPARHPRWA